MESNGQVVESILGIAEMLEFQAKIALSEGRADIKLDAKEIVPKIVAVLRALDSNNAAERV